MRRGSNVSSCLLPLLQIKEAIPLRSTLLMDLDPVLLQQKKTATSANLPSQPSQAHGFCLVDSERKKKYFLYLVGEQRGIVKRETRRKRRGRGRARIGSREGERSRDEEGSRGEGREEAEEEEE